jgi:hypothetical protein
VDKQRSELGLQGSAALWYAFLGAPIVWFVQLGLIYIMVPLACVANNTAILHVIDLVALALALLAGWLALRIWRRTGSGGETQPADPETRSRFMALIGMMASPLFSLVLLAQLLGIIVLGPCIPLPRVRFTPDASNPPAQEVMLAHAAR